ncbi:MAG: NADH-quinone oxidoreductase subunit L [Pirellulaceae bacterium]
MDSTLKTLMILVPALPLAAAIAVAALGPRLLRAHSHWPVLVALVASCLGSLLLLRHVRDQAVGYEHVETYWTWVLMEDAYTPADGLPTGDGQQAFSARPFTVDVALRLDALTCIMLTMVTFISLLVAIYSVGYMRGDPGYWRFFSYIGLFVFSMTMLVSVSNFLLLFVFWEAVGVCSYLLIGFWYERPAAAAAGMKAFLVNRIGDFGFMLGVFLIWTTYGTLNYHDTIQVSQSVMGGEVRDLSAPSTTVPVDGVLGVRRIASQAYVGGGTSLAIGLLLLLGACGKSAQFPLHVWLPDAMEGPTPVSALIHAATMVTAGVYMVTRCTPLFMASPDAQLVVAAIGTFTALLAGLIALTQFDLKRVLAYSTVSQLGYMFLGLGTGTLAGISAGMFHLFTHAFFKSLLFLAAGSVMHAMGNVIDMRRFGGLRKVMPATYWTFLIGCLALSGVAPLSGFWSKDAILASVHAKVHALEHERVVRHETAASGEARALHRVATGASDAPEAMSAALRGMSDVQLARGAGIYRLLYYTALLVAFLTSVYTFRMFYLTFFGQQRIPAEAHGHAHESPRVMVWPLVVLAIFAAGVGLWLDRSYLNGTHPFAQLLATTPSLTGVVAGTEALGEFHLSVATTSLLIALAGIAFSSYLYLGDRHVVKRWQAVMELQPLYRITNGENLVRLGRQPWMQRIGAWAERWRLWGLMRVLTDIVRLIALVLSAPLLLSRFISPYGLSYGKFFLDEVYNVLIVVPLRGVARVCAVLDDALVDGMVNAAGRAPLLLGSVLRSMQTGLVQFYALGMVVGGLVLLVGIDQQLSARVWAWFIALWGAGGSP